MGLTIEEFAPASVSERVLRGYYGVTKAVYEHDGGESEMPPIEAMVARMRAFDSEIGPRRFWIAEEDGRVIGLALMVLPALENADRAAVTVRVAPSWRRRGVGTELLRTVLPVLSAEGRNVVQAFDVTVGDDGEKWALALGFGRVQQTAQQELIIAEVDPQRWQVPAPEGYRAQQWNGTAPEDLVASFAQARGAIADAPRGDATYEFPSWTVDRVRQSEAAARQRGSEVRTVVAVAEADGQVAALTELEVVPGMPQHGFQSDTVVVPAHRGRGLGRFVKTQMLHWLLDEAPSVERISTANAIDNSYMIRINEELGFTLRRVIATVEAKVSTLRTRLKI